MPFKYHIEIVTTLSKNRYIKTMVLLQIDTKYFLQVSGTKENKNILSCAKYVRIYSEIKSI